MKHFFKWLGKSIFAGILIGIAGWGFLANPMLGMFLFCVGLIGVVKYEAKLYTGSAGFMQEWIDFPLLLLTLLGNIIGCSLVGFISLFSPLALTDAAIGIITTRMTLGWLNCGVLAIGCGLLMSFAVQYARRDCSFSDWLPLLFAVPAFILCGFPHCIADAFYCMVNLFNTPWCSISFATLLSYYASIVVGNLIGCNLYRLFVWE